MPARWSSRDSWIAWGGFVLLMALHLDSWRPQRPVLYMGWIPEEILYRLGWIGLVWAYLLFLTSRPYLFGPSPPERVENADSGSKTRDTDAVGEGSEPGGSGA